MTHEIEILVDFADAVLAGTKTFEIRENDRGYQAGDLLKFKVVDRHGLLQYSNHLLSKTECRVTYVLSGWGLKEGYVCLGIKPLSKLGHWIDEGENKAGVLGVALHTKRCSVCGYTHGLLIPSNYCPKCGTMMEAEND